MRMRINGWTYKKARNWTQLLISCGVIYLFVFVLAPAMQTMPFIKEIHHHSQENDIDASALFYTEIEEFGDADVSIRDSMNYSAP